MRSTIRRQAALRMAAPLRLWNGPVPGVGLVAVQTCDGNVTGTGFMVGPTTMVTAAHVVAGAVGLSVSFGATSVGATVTGVDSSIDLAVLRLARGSGSR
jgi:hypothetical protein